MYKFSKPNQSPWLIDVYNKYLPYKTNGFLVEIGVGHTLEGVDKTLPDNANLLSRIGSNTADLLDLGWSGIYIDPVKEYCEEAEIAHKNNLDRLKIINIGASDQSEQIQLYLGDSFIPNNYGNCGYNWIGRTILTKKTSDILGDCALIDLMSIDVEGFEDRVIKGIDFYKHYPLLLVIEVDKISVQQILEFLPNYILVKTDGLNAVFILK